MSQLKTATRRESQDLLSRESRGGHARRYVLILFAVGHLLATALLAAGTVCRPPHRPPTLGDAVSLVPAGDLPAEVVAEAIELWRGCAGYGRDFPLFLDGPGGLWTIQIRLRRGESGSARCGIFEGTTITLHEEAVGPSGRQISCGSLVENLAHELGHALGLGHVEDRKRCATQIMGRITHRSRYGRQVTRQECAAAGASWVTSSELGAARRQGYVVTGSPSLEEIDALVKTPMEIAAH